MPAGRETAPPKALSGYELQEILVQDFRRLLRNNSMLAPHLAFGRVAYTIHLAIHLDKISGVETGRPSSDISISSRAIAQNIINHPDNPQPQLAAIEPPPLSSPSEDAEVFGSSLTREISAPNLERIRAGLPITIERKDLAGNTRTEGIIYPAEDAPGVGAVTIKDTSIDLAKSWGVPPPQFEVVSESRAKEHPTKE